MKIKALLFTALALFSFSVLAQNIIKVDRPELKVGEFWIYNSIDSRYMDVKSRNVSRTIRAVTQKGIEIDWQNLETKASGTSLLNKNLNLVETTGYGGRAYTPEEPVLTFPLYVGATWTREYVTDYKDGRHYNMRLVATVDSFEEITVPAGTFNTFKILVSKSYVGFQNGTNTRSGVSEEVMWYAPKVKQVVRITYVERPLSFNGYSTSGSSSPIVSELIRFEVQ